MVQIKRLGVFQNAKLASLLYFIISSLVLMPFGFIILFTGGKTKSGLTWWMVMLMPLIYYVIAFIITVLTCIIYNIIAKKIGGISLELKE